MNDNLRLAQQRLAKRMAGDGPIQKQIILLKLTDLIDNAPSFEGKEPLSVPSPQQSWVSAVGALLKRLDKIGKGVKFDAAVHTITQHSGPATDSIKRLICDAIEELKLELELDGRDEIGNAYAPGKQYDYFRDLKEVIGGAESEIFVIDPYFNGEAFDAYLSEVRTATIAILADRYSVDAKTYAQKHAQQHGTQIELRKSKELHDRLIIIDGSDCWITGGSVKDAGKKASYLIPAAPQVAQAKYDIYRDIWSRATPLS